MSLMGWIEWIGKGVGVAGVAAIIRVSSTLEISGRWPWQRSGAQESLSANARPETR